MLTRDALKPLASKASFARLVILNVQILFWFPNLAEAQTNYVPFVIPGDDATPTVTDQSRLIAVPVAEEFVTIRDSKFYVGDHRLKFWGFNLCFGANFPTHEETDRIVPHFAKLGINAIRFHHMDMLDAPGGIWRRDADGRRQLDPQQIDRLDYFLARLHEHGIYANLNLHVSRTLEEIEGFPRLKEGPWWSTFNKWVMYYDRDVQQELKEFSRQLLTHQNPYRDNRRRLDDPGIAVLEMLNENYFTEQGVDLIQHLPNRYVQTFRIAWNQWLMRKYQSTVAMKAAWEADQEPLGPLQLSPARWSQDLNGWELSLGADQLPRRFGVAASTDINNNKLFAIRLEPKQRSEQPHFQQLIYRQLSLQQDVPYTFSFWVRSDRDRELNMEVSSIQNDQWRDVGVFETVKATKQWTKIQRVFFAKETLENEAFIAFSFGSDITPLEFAAVTLQRGIAAVELPADQSLEKSNVDVPQAGWPQTAHRDLRQFMVDTERNWILELKQYLIDLGAKVPITASQENYHAAGVLAETVDFIDFHNYWHHPTFPAGRDFNPTDYRTGNDPLEAFPTKSNWPTNSLLMRTGWRYHGLPFTLSEWNHAEPSDVSSGCVMTGAAIAAIQDWDGIFFFEYESGTSVWFKDHFRGFFAFNSQPVKLATFSIAANIFLRGDLPPLPEKLSGTYDDRLDGRLAFQYRIGVDPNASVSQTGEIPADLNFSTPNGNLVWSANDPDTGYLQIDTPKTQGVWGLTANGKFSTNDCSIEVGQVLRNYATIVATAMDDRPLYESGSILVIASSGAENTDMQWNEDRTSVSDQWGTGPTRVNLVPAKVTIGHKNAAACAVFALDGTGQRIGQVATRIADGGLQFETGQAELGTIWYEVNCQ